MERGCWLENHKDQIGIKTRVHERESRNLEYIFV